MKLSELMTTNVEVCNPESSLTEVAGKMKELNVGVMPICEQDKLVGVVTDRDLVINGLANELEAKAQVSQVMSESLVTGHKEMSVKEAADLMAEHQIRRLPIVEDERLVGIVSLGDLAVNQETNDDAGQALEQISAPTQSMQ
ncbi:MULTISPECIES: CBS domain-containing protein [unclassified Bacillus (in: firmicutes)]|uniref:CBS domain-containing protein n=1 Tax=unclassified Bacillus (in: firmicutes) TaxID=185979 RepID=UPI0008E118A2|nr:MULTISPECIES: CBS domain-containing protein [unclassified Bacillus (in: firmicutes)]SFA91084.1 CBS domain-containing protein [Bacillus sp. UNCCL13]SFQ85492.1 CBS domain-containing protein [Bacillus sp. cl95]